MEKRYSRQIFLPEVGVQGQKALGEAKILVVGAGGLGSPCLQYLAAAGVGTLGIVDDDVVDISNLQRQVLYGNDVVGQAKVLAAKKRLANLNPQVQVITFQTRLRSENALKICADFDLIVDGTDNFNTKYLLNEVSRVLRKPLVYGSVSRFEGHVAVFDGEQGPCYRCLYPEPPQSQIGNCAEQGVLGALPGVVGSMQAVESLKWVLFTKNGQECLKPLIGRLWVADFKTMQFQNLLIQPRSGCSCRKEQRKLFANLTERMSCETVPEKSWDNYFQSNPRPLLMDVRSRQEYEEKHLPEALWGVAAIEGLPPGTDVYVCCKSGVRSIQVCQDLRALGYQAFSLRGGILGLVEYEKSQLVE